jgi:hypothetical protein
MNREELKAAFIAMVERERDTTGDATRREFLHRLLGSLRKV